MYLIPRFDSKRTRQIETNSQAQFSVSTQRIHIFPGVENVPHASANYDMEILGL